MAVAPNSTSQAAMLKYYRLSEALPDAWEDPTLPNRPTSASGRPRSPGRSISPAAAAENPPGSPGKPGSGVGIQRSSVIPRGHHRNTSRYSILEQEGGYRPLSTSRGSMLGVPGVAETNIPQDEPDPLGSSDSVVSVLRNNGVYEVDNNLRLRNRYLISSKTFSPSDFLRDVHTTTSAQGLQSGLDFLSTSISEKSSALKQLVSNNFDRFVLAKSTIDAVFEEMKMGTSSSARNSAMPGQNGDVSRYNGSFRLNKEDEWGLRSIRTPLTEAGSKAEVIFGPMLENQGREEKLRVMLNVLEKEKGSLELTSVIVDAIKRKDYIAIKEEYYKAKKVVESARKIARHGKSPSEPEIHKIIIAERMWAEVEEIIEEYKRDTWRRLADTEQNENFMDLIGTLLELGVSDNPIQVWLASRYEHLKKKISVQFERSRVEIEVLRRRLALAPPASIDMVGHILRTTSRQSTTVYDVPLVTAFWELLQSSLSSLLSPTDGLVGELIAFWSTAQNFIDGRTQKNLPIGPDDTTSTIHHRLSEEYVASLRKGGAELVQLIIQSITEFFMNHPIDDISSLVSPLAITPASSVPPTPNSAPHTPVSTTQPASQFLLKKPTFTPGDAFAFLAPNSNALGGTHFLAVVLGFLGTAASELAKLPIGKGSIDNLRAMVSGSRERCVHALCISWLRDSKDCRALENWTRASDNRDITKMPSLFMGIEGAIILGMQDILYVNKAKADPSTQVIIPPSNGLVNEVRQHFVKSLYVALHGMFELANSSNSDGAIDETELASPIATIAPTGIMAFSINKKDKNVRRLLTLSNLQELRAKTVPQLMEQFETAFGLTLTEEKKSIKDSLIQIDKQLFDQYTIPHAQELQRIVQAGVLSPDWEPPGRALDVKPYVHDALLSMVLVHAQVITTTATLTHRIISFLLEHLSFQLLNAFKSRPFEKFSLSALLQATLDVEFVNQTLSQFNTDRARELQQEIYVELDKRSDGPARTALQKELADMRTVLTGLRRGTRAEFLCFRQKKTRV